jgi:hypothetical protein
VAARTLGASGREEQGLLAVAVLLLAAAPVARALFACWLPPAAPPPSIPCRPQPRVTRLVLEAVPADESWLMRRAWMVSLLVSLVPPPAGAAGGAPDDAAVKAALCPGGRRCRVASRTSAGRDADGLELVVARAKVLGKGVGGRPADSPEGPCLLEPVGVFRLRDGVVVSHEPIMTLYQQSECWYGSTGGDEELTVQKGQAVFDSEGGTSWRWTDHKVWALSPRVTLVSTVHEEWNNFSVVRRLIRTNHLRDRTEVIWRSPVCGREPDEVGGGGAVEGDPAAYRYLVIPRSPPSAAGTEDGWREDRNNLRWLNIDSSGASGYVVHGKPGDAGDAGLRVTALGDRLLLVDVADDRLVPAAEPWIHADHLELWATPDAPGPLDECLERRRAPPDDGAPPVGPAWQWGVMLDGAIHPGAGRPPAAPVVAVAEVDTRWEGKVRRFRIELPRNVGAVTVVYSDSDDGVNQKRLIATSRLRFGDAASLGKVEGDRHGRE